MRITISIDDSPQASGRGSPWINPFQPLSDDASTESSDTSNDPSKLLLQSIGQMMSAMAPLLSILSQLLQQVQQMAGGGQQQGANDIAQDLARLLGGDDDASPLGGGGFPALGGGGASPRGGCGGPPSGGAGRGMGPGSCTPHGAGQGSHLPRNGGVGTSELSSAAGAGGLSDADSKKMAVTVADKLMKDFPGLSKEGAAGIVGNLYHESWGMNPNINEGGAIGDPNGSDKGYGWAQWSYDRKKNYLNFCQQNGMDPGSPEANYAMLKHELQTSEKGTLDAMKGARTPEQAADIFRQVYERAENPVDEKRRAAANMIYGLMG